LSVIIIRELQAKGLCTNMFSPGS